jgi:hypothetical protein
VTAGAAGAAGVAAVLGEAGADVRASVTAAGALLLGASAGSARAIETAPMPTHAITPVKTRMIIPCWL